MQATHSRFALKGLALALLLTGTQVQAAALSWKMIKAIPIGEQSHTVQVQLDQQGHWSVVPSDIVKMRIEYAHTWAYKPNHHTYHAFLHVGESKGGSQEAYGKYYQDTQIYSLTSAQMMAKSGIVNLNVPFKYLVPDGIPGTDISGYCSFEKDNRLKQGKTLNAVLRQGFNVKLTAPLHLDGWYSEGGGPNTSRPESHERYEHDNTAPITIKCLGNPAIADKVAPLTNMNGPNALAVKPFAVSSVELVALQNKLVTVCPSEITLKATVKGVGGGEIKYWLEALNGQEAAVQQTSTLPGKPGEASQRVIMQKVSLKPSALQKPQAIDTLKANTQGTLVKRSYRFNVLAPNKLQSQKVDLEVICTSTLNGGLGAQDKGVKQPQQPQPPKPELKLQAPQAQPTQPELRLQAPQAQPQPPKPELKLQAVPLQPPKPMGTFQAQ